MSDLTEAISILKITPNERRQPQLLKLMYATRNIMFFKQITEEQKSDKVHAACCQALTYRNYDTNDIVFNFRDEGTFFGVILKGKVRVLVPSYDNSLSSYQEKYLNAKEKDSEPEKLNHQILLTKVLVPRKLPEISKSATRLGVSDSGDKLTPRLRKEKNASSKNSCVMLNKEETSHRNSLRHDSPPPQPIDDGYIPGFLEINKLGLGSCFGELSLLTDARRAATIQCMEPTTIAILNKEDYIKTLGGLQERQINDKVDFLHSLKPFQRWSKLSLMKLSYHFSVKNIKRGQVLYKEGDPANYVYFIKAGEFKFTKNMRIETPLEMTPPDISPPRRNIFNKKSSELQILIKGPGEMLGHDEILDKSSVRISTCSCISFNAELYSISDKDFLKRIPDPGTWEYINNTYSLQNDWKKKRLSNLREIEEYKHSMTFTPFHVIQTLRNSSQSPNKDEQSTVNKDTVKLHRNVQTTGIYRPSDTFRKSIRSYTNAYNRELQQRNGRQIVKSCTPGPQIYQRSEQDSKLGIYPTVFTTELRPEDFYLTQRIRKERRPPPNFLPAVRHSEDMLVNRSGSHSPRLPNLSKFKPHRLKPTRQLTRRAQSISKESDH